jgi:hypothetical protein
MQRSRQLPLCVLSPEESPNCGHDVLHAEAVIGSGRALQKGLNPAEFKPPQTTRILIIPKEA